MKKLLINLWAVAYLASGCSDALLDAKPDQALVIPKALTDFGSLLDNSTVFNVSPSIHHIAADDFLITDDGWNALPNPAERNSYIWADDVYEGQRILDWNKPYEQVFYSNIVLEGLANLDSANQLSEYRRLKGSALFYRGLAFYNLAQSFCAPFLTNEDGKRLGIPLRLTADINAPISRASVSETYQQLFDDLREASSLLPATAVYTTQPTRAAALALLARANLVCGRYAEALAWANRALAERSALLDFNGLDASSARPLPDLPQAENPEVLFFEHLTTYRFNANSARNVYVPKTLYDLYEASDLRKVIFFTPNTTGEYVFSGSFISSIRLFSGPSTGEMFLTKAECLARLGQMDEALLTLNTLLEQRYLENSFTPYEAENTPDILDLILVERRKELIGRGLRWSDLRRLNAEAGRETIVTRTVHGQTYQLEPGSGRYVFPLPDEEVRLAGLPQNPR